MPKSGRLRDELQGRGNESDLIPGSLEAVSTITTAIHIPKNTWRLLRAVAFRRAQDSGGRVSVSRLVAELVEKHRRELEREIS
jgi:hypothetical protein